MHANKPHSSHPPHSEKPEPKPTPAAAKAAEEKAVAAKAAAEEPSNPLTKKCIAHLKKVASDAKPGEVEEVVRLFVLDQEGSGDARSDEAKLKSLDARWADHVAGKPVPPPA